METSNGERTRLVGKFQGGGNPGVVAIFGDEQLHSLDGIAALDGSIVEARWRDGKLAQPKLLAAADSARAKMYEIAAQHKLDPVFPAAVERQVAGLVAAPGLDDPALTDLRAMPFVSIDGPGTRDLDQAMYVAQEDGLLAVYYALADAAWCIQPGEPLFDEALRRGSTYYLPGLAIPMLPRELSEGIVSINEKVERRALVFRMALDSSGRCKQTKLIRARILSRAQLSFEQVQEHLDNPAANPMPEGVAASLELFKRVGELRLEDAERRDVVQYRRTESEVKLARMPGARFVVKGGMRTKVERYNEQLSLLCNVEGAYYLREDAGKHQHVQPIYRVHPAPDKRRYIAFEELLQAMCKRHKLDAKDWTWRRSGNRSLADFLADLPSSGEQGQLARAIHRQAVMANVRSSFSKEPGKHHGVGADVYARFSAPMREVVGVFLHKEALEKLAGHSRRSSPEDEALREVVVKRANASKSLQKRVAKQANEVVLDQLFDDELKRAPADRPSRAGTVMGMTASKLHVQLDSPNIEVKLYTRHLAETAGEAVRLSRDGIQMHTASGRQICRLGDGVQVRVRERDRQQRRWVIELLER